MTRSEYGWRPGERPAVVDLTGEPRAAAPLPQGAVPSPAWPAPRPTRLTRLRLTRVDPWSVFRIALVVSLVLLVVGVAAVLTLYTALEGLGVFDVVNRTLTDLTGGTGGSPWQLLLSPGRVLVVTVLIGFVDVVLITALVTLSAVGYNLISSLVGGLEVTVTETD